MMHQKTRNIIFTLIVGLACTGLIVLSRGNTVSADSGEFSLQVSPSPLVTTLKPGQTTTLELKVYNAGTQTENLKIAPRSFTINNTTGELKFDDTKLPEVASWTSFSAPNFTVDPGQTFSEEVTFAVPKDAGFSYSFALVINRQNAAQTTDSGGRLLKGSVAIFTLINIDRPGAVRQLQIAHFAPSQSVYEYLPAKLNVEFKNTGNTIVQPAGNIFIQRGSDDKTPISTLSVNPNSGYILPGSVRTLSVSWEDGFQVLHPVTASDGTVSQQLTWNWGNLSHLRIGQYTAKVVAIYNDGQRDIPVTGEVTFWVIPWKLLLGALVVVGLVVAGVWSFVRTLIRVSKKGRKHIRF
jgi:hypothetical protein